MTEQTQERYSLTYLSQYIALTMLMTGEKPTVIRLTPDYYTWYVQEVNRMADMLGLQLGFRGEKPTYSDIPVEKMEKKVKIELS